MLIRLTLSLAALFTVCVIAASGETNAIHRARMAQAQQRSALRRVDASRYPGNDLGAKVNRADSALGENAGEILVHGGGTFSTAALISSAHTLRLGLGTYYLVGEGPLIVLQDNTSVIGSGWGTVLVDRSSNWSALRASNFNNGRNAKITVRDLQLRGENRCCNGGTGIAIYLINCVDCAVDNVWLNEVRAIGIQIGGGSQQGHHAENVRITNSKFTRTGFGAIAVVNGRNITIDKNTFYDLGQVSGPGGSYAIDFEVNTPTDVIENVVVTNNLLDARGSVLVPFGNFITYQPNPKQGPALFSSNTVIGGLKTSNGVIMSPHARDVVISDNNFSGLGQSGLYLSGSRLCVRGNRLSDTGTGGNYSISVSDVTDSWIGENIILNPTIGLSAIVEQGASNNNVYVNNSVSKIVLTGRLSRKLSSGTARSTETISSRLPGCAR